MVTPSWGANRFDIGSLRETDVPRGWIVSVLGSFDLDAGFAVMTLALDPVTVALWDPAEIARVARQQSLRSPPRSPIMSALYRTFSKLQPERAQPGRRAGPHPMYVTPCPRVEDTWDHVAPRQAWEANTAAHASRIADIPPSSASARIYLADVARVAPWMLLAAPLVHFARSVLSLPAGVSDLEVALAACEIPRAKGRPPSLSELDLTVSLADACQGLEDAGVVGASRLPFAVTKENPRRINERRKRFAERADRFPTESVMLPAGAAIRLPAWLLDRSPRDRWWLLRSPFRVDAHSAAAENAAALEAGAPVDLVGAAADKKHALMLAEWMAARFEEWRAQPETEALLRVLRGDGHRRWSDPWQYLGPSVGSMEPPEGPTS